MHQVMLIIETALIRKYCWWGIVSCLSSFTGLVTNLHSSLFYRTCTGSLSVAWTHTWGNALTGQDKLDYVDKLCAISWFLTCLFAVQSHALHHQNESALRKQFHISREAARHIIKTCDSCPTTHDLFLRYQSPWTAACSIMADGRHSRAIFWQTILCSCDCGHLFWVFGGFHSYRWSCKTCYCPLFPHLVCFRSSALYQIRQRPNRLFKNFSLLLGCF